MSRQTVKKSILPDAALRGLVSHAVVGVYGLENARSDVSPVVSVVYGDEIRTDYQAQTEYVHHVSRVKGRTRDSSVVYEGAVAAVAVLNVPSAVGLIQQGVPTGD